MSGIVTLSTPATPGDYLERRQQQARQRVWQNQYCMTLRARRRRRILTAIRRTLSCLVLGAAFACVAYLHAHIGAGP
ncbi:MAG: hypothetical protein WCF85_01250 [Rhodospirillaceae bacterium]